jgi:LuxR family transcriptional regulator, maltose regulon positive regulatory protein
VTESVLRTKFQVPRQRPLLVARPDLVHKLSQGLTGRLTLVSAPAGYGKTTLVAHWVSTLVDQTDLPGWRLCWLSLDQEDDDPARFLLYLMTALQSAMPSVDDTDRHELRNLQAAGLTVGLAYLINLLDKMAGPTILVIDDFHLIAEPAIHRGVDFLVEHLPQAVHVVLISRADPPLALSRLRARGQLSEIRQSDLQFSNEEAAAFLTRSAGLSLAAEDASCLNERVEGWAAGLQLAALAIQAQSGARLEVGRTQFIRSFAASDRYIMDYLVEEVLQQQPDDIKHFLLHTAVLDRLTAPLCAALLADEGAAVDERQVQHILDRLEMANLFILPLDNERCWYRYHNLFADLLRKRLQQHRPELLPELHGRASHWFENHELPDLAVNHAIMAGDIERACHLVDLTAEGMMMQSQIVTLLRWLDNLPPAAIQQRPSLAATYAGALLLQGRPLAEVDRWLQQTVALAGHESRGEISIYQALLAVYRLDTVEAMRLAGEALRLLPEKSVFLRSLATEVKAFVYTIEGDLALAQQAFGEAVEIGRATGSLLIAVGSLCNQAGLLVFQGQLHRAQAIYEQALALSVTQSGIQLPIASKALIGLGEIYREWDELAEAERLTRQGLDLYLDYTEAAVVFGLLSLARVKQSRGEFDAAQQLVERARQSAVRFDVTELDDFLVDCFQAQLWLAQGHVAAAASWASGRSASRSSLPAPLCEMEDMVLIRLHLARGEPDKALALLRPLVTLEEQRAFNGRLIKLLVLQALAHWVSRAPEPALAALTRALALAAREGFKRVFLDEGQPMAEMLQLAIGQHVVPEFTAALLGSFARDRTPSSEAKPPVPAGSLIEPLSDREMEVLQLIADGLSNSQIADRLVISLSTVKGHASNVYRKLNVQNRTQAVARARALGMIVS